MIGDARSSSDGIRLVDDQIWEKLKLPRSDLNRLDPGLRSVLALIDQRDWYSLEQRTGIRWNPEGQDLPQYLPLLVEYRWKEIGISRASAALVWLSNLGLQVGKAYFNDVLPTYTTARVAVRTDRPDLLYRKDSDLLTQVARLLSEKDSALRLELPGASQAFGEDSLADIGETPEGPRPKEPDVDGSGVVIGIIDDGCAFAHPNFVRDGDTGPETRILCLWDQGWVPAGAPTPPSGFTYGRELTKASIDLALNAHTSNGIVDEDAVYRQLDYTIADLSSHGTHVMDIAAGSGRALTSTPGVAPNADIIFVQLPAASIERGGAALDEAIADGVRYIFDRAGSRGAVINISYGGYAGPHNGRSTVESRIDEELQNAPNRAVVVAAGNGFEADCHAGGSLLPGRRRNLSWVVKPEDPTANILEVWYDAGAMLTLTLTTPAGTQLGPVALGAVAQDIKSTSGELLGTIDHQKAVTPSGLNRIRIMLHPTGSLPLGANTPLAPSGTWQVRLLNVGTGRARWDAWIERDTAGRSGGARRMQSHFHPRDAQPRNTLGSYATAQLAISVGAYNTATQQVSRYSACGPTRDGRHKPEVLAPAEEDAAGRGVISASSRSALPRRMNGTSAAAPQVAGLVALLFQAAAQKGQVLTAAQVRDLVCDGAKHARPLIRPLLPNAHVAADDRRKIKQGEPSIWPHLTGNGKLNWPKTRELLP